MIHLTTSPGVIISPDSNNDGLYDFNVDILWIVEAKKGEVIRYKLTALIRFSDNCQADGLKVFEPHHKERQSTF